MLRSDARIFLDEILDVGLKLAKARILQEGEPETGDPRQLISINYGRAQSLCRDC